MREMPQFRQQLDNLLRTRDVQRVQAFLIESGQWYEGTPANPELAMWLMIAGSDKLRDLHMEAREWLASHGHENAAEAILGKAAGQAKATQARSGGQSRGGKRPQGNAPRKQHTGNNKSAAKRRS